MTDKRLLTPAEVAKRLRVTRRTVYQWLSDGDLPAFKAGRSWRISEEQLEEFLRLRPDARLIKREEKGGEKAEMTERLYQYKYELHPDFPREEWRRKYYNEEKGYYECYFCGEMAYPGGPFEWKDGSDGFKYIWLIEPPRCLDCDAELK